MIYAEAPTELGNVRVGSTADSNGCRRLRLLSGVKRTSLVCLSCRSAAVYNNRRAVSMGCERVGIARTRRSCQIECAQESGVLFVGHGRGDRHDSSKSRRRRRRALWETARDGALAAAPRRFAPGGKDSAVARV